MKPLIVNAAIKLAEGIYYFLNNNSDSSPRCLSGNALALFQEFKSAIDSKNKKKLGNTISESYSGIFLGAKTKCILLNCFYFEKIPSLIYPSLTINVYQILEDNDQIFRIVLDFKTYYKLILVSFTSIEFGRIYVEARPDGNYGIWKITRIDTIPD